MNVYHLKFGSTHTYVNVQNMNILGLNVALEKANGSDSCSKAKRMPDMMHC